MEESNMKKLFSVVLVLMIMLSLAACGKDSKTTGKKDKKNYSWGCTD